MNLSLTTRSFVLFGAGEGHALIDADITFHASGFPYVPGRRLKGLLRESLMEVMEIFGHDELEVVATVGRLFGSAGSMGPEGGLIIPNLYLPDWKLLQEKLKEAQKQDPIAFHIDHVKRHFCSEIPQTAVKDGVAKDKSLRLYRVLNPGHTFTASITGIDQLSTADQVWFKHAVTNLKSAGTRRNKGFGDISLQLIEMAPTEEVPPTEVSSHPENGRLRITVKTCSPVLLSVTEAEQNTVTTERHIPGSVLRGLFAEILIRSLAEKKGAHTNVGFRENILLGKIQFGPCFLKGTQPLPLNLQVPKGKENTTIVDGFRNQQEALRSIKGMGKIGTGTLEKTLPATTFMFHNSRPNRSAGKSMEQDAEQGIFYYEALSEGQTFEGELHGNPETLLQFANQVGWRLECQMGRSRSAQYGNVQINLEVPNEVGKPLAKSAEDRYYLQVLSPLILLNENGEAQADQAALKAAMTRTGLEAVKIMQAMTQHKFVELYNSVWASKTNRWPAYVAGSVLELDVPEAQLPCLQALAQNGLGEWRALGYGKLRVWRKEDFPAELNPVGKPAPASDPKSTPSFQLGKIDWGNGVLQEIWSKEVAQSAEVAVRLKALRDVKQKGLPNHLASRILAKLTESQQKGEDGGQVWAAWLQDIKAKPAGKKLEDKGLYDKLLAIQSALPPEIVSCPNLPKSITYYGFLYWITFFETMRKRKEES